MWLWLLLPVAGYLGYKAYAPTSTLKKLDPSLTSFQRLELSNALNFVDDPQHLNVMYAGLLSGISTQDHKPAPIAAEAIRRKMVHLQTGGTNATFPQSEKNYDFSATT